MLPAAASLIARAAASTSQAMGKAQSTSAPPASGAPKKHRAAQDAWVQVDVEWDNGRKLMLSVPTDRLEVLPGEAVK